MISFVAWFTAQQAAGGFEGIPSLGTIISAFAAVCILFVLRAVIITRDETRDLTHDMGDMKGDVRALGERFTRHVEEEEKWQYRLTENIAESNKRTHLHLTSIEASIPPRRTRKASDG